MRKAYATQTYHFGSFLCHRTKKETVQPCSHQQRREDGPRPQNLNRHCYYRKNQTLSVWAGLLHSADRCNTVPTVTSCYLFTVTVIRASASIENLSSVATTTSCWLWIGYLTRELKIQMVPRLCLTMTVSRGRGTRKLSSPRPDSTRTTNRDFFFFWGFLMPRRSGPQEISPSHKRDDGESAYDWFNNTWRWILISTICIFSSFLAFGNTLLSKDGLLERFEYW